MYNRLLLVLFIISIIVGCGTISDQNYVDAKDNSTKLDKQKHSYLLTNHKTQSVALQLVNSKHNSLSDNSKNQLYKSIIKNDFGKSDNSQSPSVQIIAEKRVFEDSKAILFVVSSYLNSLELSMSRVIFFQHNYTFQEVPIIENSNIKEVVMIPIDFSLDHDHLVQQFSTVLHEMTHIEGAFKSKFVKKPTAITFREEYEAYKMGICFNFWVNAFHNQKLDREQLNSASIETSAMGNYETYNQNAEHLKKLKEFPENFLISAQAKALVIENFNYFNFSFCESVLKQSQSEEGMSDQLKLLINGKFDITPDIKLLD